MTAGIAAQLRRRLLLAVGFTSLTAWLTATAPTAQLSTQPLAHERTPVIVLDPGRGGADQGAQGPTGLQEKDLTLQVATEAGRLIEELLGWRVVLTRTDDSAIALEARAALANQADGDLYVSIFVGSSFAPIRRDFQLFYFEDWQGDRPSTRQPPSGVWPARRDSVGQGGNDGPPGPILWDQAQVEFSEMSQTFARMLYKNLRAQVGVDGRGIVGLPLLPLRWIRMPAVLVDLGSLNDPSFADRLQGEAYLQRAALGIAQAVNDYQALQR